jgi:hypothetical protein
MCGRSLPVVHVKSGVDAELHAWDGLNHALFYNIDLSELREPSMMVGFFCKHLNPSPVRDAGPPGAKRAGRAARCCSFWARRAEAPKVSGGIRGKRGLSSPIVEEGRDGLADLDW